MKEETRPNEILSHYYISPDDHKIKCESNICFGIDEYFLNNVLFKYLLKKDKPFSYINLFDMSQFYFFKHPKNINIENSNLAKNEYGKIFTEYMEKIDLDKYSFDEIDKQIYTPDNEKLYSSSRLTTDFMEMYGRKMISLLENLVKKKTIGFTQKVNCIVF
jgi:hypothetical protein